MTHEQQSTANHQRFAELQALEARLAEAQDALETQRAKAREQRTEASVLKVENEALVEQRRELEVRIGLAEIRADGLPPIACAIGRPDERRPLFAQAIRERDELIRTSGCTTAKAWGVVLERTPGLRERLVKEAQEVRKHA